MRFNNLTGEGVVNGNYDLMQLPIFCFIETRHLVFSGHGVDT